MTSRKESTGKKSPENSEDRSSASDISPAKTSEILSSEFIEFLKSNFKQTGDYYIPKNPSHNEYRHFGERTEEGLLLKKEEVQYLFCKIPLLGANLYTKIYFDLKNLGFNILEDKEEHSINIYQRKKHFNRNNESPIMKLILAEGDAQIEHFTEKKELIAVMGYNDYCLIETKTVKKLSLETHQSLRKNYKEEKSN